MKATIFAVGGAPSVMSWAKTLDRPNLSCIPTTPSKFVASIPQACRSYTLRRWGPYKNHEMTINVPYTAPFSL